MINCIKKADKGLFFAQGTDFQLLDWCSKAELDLWINIEGVKKKTKQIYLLKINKYWMLDVPEYHYHPELGQFRWSLMCS